MIHDQREQSVRFLLCLGLLAVLGAAQVNAPPESYISWNREIEPGTASNQYNPKFGNSICAGDLDGDGRDDMIVGSWAQNRVMVFSGAGHGLMLTIDGPAAGTRFGWSVDSGRDINGDGRDDLVVGAPGYQSSKGAVYAYSGAGLTGSGNPLIAGPHIGTAFGIELGYDVAILGDLDNDGFAEYGGGAPYHDSSVTDSGAIMTFRGSDSSAYAYRYGTAANQRFGWRLVGIGDMTGNGRNDFAVSSPFAYANERGAVWIYDGSGSLATQFIGNQPNGWFGYDIDAVGDVDLDGTPEVIVGAPGQSGGLGRVEIRNIGTVHFSVSGTLSYHKFGTAVAGLGDVNGDGYPDFVFRRAGPALELPLFGGGFYGTPLVYTCLPGGAFVPYATLVQSIGYGVDLASGGDTNGDGINEVLYSTTSHSGTGQGSDAGYAFRYRLDGDPPLNPWYTTPAAPRGLTATTSDTRQIAVRWRAFPNCLGYDVYRDGSHIARTPPWRTDYVDIPTPGPHTYAVRAFHNVGNGATATIPGNRPSWDGTDDFRITVSAESSVFLAGRTSHGLTLAEGRHPDGTAVGVPAFGALSIVTQSGAIDVDGRGGLSPFGAEGVTGVSTNINSANGVSGIVHGQRGGFLCGVFLGPQAPSGLAPPSLNFSAGAIGDDFDHLFPELEQVFFVGDGLTGHGSGDVQQFHVPAGATRLYFGICDAPNFHGNPLAYNGNHGEWSVRVVNDFPGVHAYGTPTPGCLGPAVCWSRGAPHLANGSFGLTAENAHPNLGGVAIVGLGGLSTPVVYNLVDVWVDPGLPFATHYWQSNAAGEMFHPLPIPAQPSFLGLPLFGQFLVFEPTGCTASGLSGSNALRIEIVP
ncbi:MAG: FG-GAP repeat protein [Planctomycetes bacterium]|nr:FG-GAP repeat protein [Planctomycetota bacterium]